MGKRNIKHSTEAKIYDDRLTVFAHPSARLFCTSLTWFSLGLATSTGNGFFSSLFLFNLPILLEFLQTIPNQQNRVYLYRVARVVNGIILLFSLLGMISILTIVEINSEKYIITTSNFIVSNMLIVKLETFWYYLLIDVAFAVIDWIAAYNIKGSSTSNELSTNEVS